jgi:hypothetical protein
MISHSTSGLRANMAPNRLPIQRPNFRDGIGIISRHGKLKCVIARQLTSTLDERLGLSFETNAGITAMGQMTPDRRSGHRNNAAKNRAIGDSAQI